MGSDGTTLPILVRRGSGAQRTSSVPKVRAVRRGQTLPSSKCTCQCPLMDTKHQVLEKGNVTTVSHIKTSQQ